MIREATKDDMTRVVEMGRRFLLEGPYKKHLADNPKAAEEFGLKVMLPLGRILVSEESGCINGVFAFLLSPHCFSGEMTATEFIWYVEPESRKMRGFGDGISTQLFDAAEKLAKDLGAKRIQMTAPTEMVGSFYKRRGYEQIEVAYQRSL